MSDPRRMKSRGASLVLAGLLAAGAACDAGAQPMKATIVGLGAATCQQFNDDIGTH